MTKSNNNVQMALASLGAAKWRSFLTMLGVIIGVTSVVTIVSLGEGVKQQLSAQVSKMLNMGGEPGTLVTFLNIHHSPSILIPSYMGYISLSDFMEKTGIPEGDAVALIPLLARHLGINKGSS